MEIVKAFILIFFISCTNELTVGQIFEKATVADPKLEIIKFDSKRGAPMNCSDYGPGCLRVVFVKIKKVVAIIIEFSTVEDAYSNALRIDGYVKDRWLFDDVTGEPVLEELVTDLYGATRPSLTFGKKK